MAYKKHIISKEEFSKMKSIFDEKIKPNLGENYSESTWQSLQDIKEYIAFIEEEAKANMINISGIRFHYVAKEDGKQQLSFAMAPTYDNEKGEHIDFDPLFSKKEAPKNLQNIDKNDPDYAKQGSIMDRGEDCPFNCDPTKK